MKSLLVIASICTGCAEYNSTAFQTGTLGAAEASLVADWHSTRYESERGWRGHSEGNVIMGPAPSNTTVDAYTAGCMTLTAFAYPFIPRAIRPLVYLAITAIEISTVNSNMKAGTPW